MMNYKYTVIILFFSLSLSQVSVNDIESMTNKKIDEMITNLKSENQHDSGLQEPNQQMGGLPQQISIPLIENNIDEEYFGYNYFSRDINFFDNIFIYPAKQISSRS